MKKTVLLLVIIAILAGFSGCKSSRTPIDAAGFKAKAEAAGYTIQDAADQVSEGSVNDYLIAVKGTDTIIYQIEFIVVPTVQEAESACKKLQSGIEALKGSSSLYSTMSVGNYSYYTLTSDGKYSSVSRVENTFIYFSASSEYKDELAAFCKGIGY